MKKVEYFNCETGKNISDDFNYFLDKDGVWWECEFGSSDSVKNATSMWAGIAHKLDFEVGVRIIENYQGTISANN